MNKTNAMRILDKAKIEYKTIEYEVDEGDLSGVSIAKKTGLNPDFVFKTLVAKGDKNGHLVFCIPCELELDLKKCARVSGDKRIELVAVKDLLSLTGYIRGGCSPVGMKKAFPTYFDETVLLHKNITVSAGARGCQLYLDAKELMDMLCASCADLTV